MLGICDVDVTKSQECKSPCSQARNRMRSVRKETHLYLRVNIIIPVAKWSVSIFPH